MNKSHQFQGKLRLINVSRNPSYSNPNFLGWGSLERKLFFFRIILFFKNKVNY